MGFFSDLFRRPEPETRIEHETAGMTLGDIRDALLDGVSHVDDELSIVCDDPYGLYAIGIAPAYMERESTSVLSVDVFFPAREGTVSYDNKCYMSFTVAYPNRGDAFLVGDFLNLLEEAITEYGPETFVTIGWAASKDSARWFFTNVVTIENARFEQGAFLLEGDVASSLQPMDIHVDTMPGGGWGSFFV